MNAQKKKPNRQRNRARNKVNRSQDDVSHHAAKNGADPEPEAQQNKAAANPLMAKALAGDTEAIKLIQQMLRARLLKDNRDTNQTQASAADISTKVAEDTKESNESKERQVTKDDKPAKATTTAATDDIKDIREKKEVPAKTADKKLPTENLKKSKSKEKIAEGLTDQNAFIANLKKKMEHVMASGDPDLPNTLLGNLQKLINQDPISDVESSDEEEEYIEYVYKPRQYFLVSLCNLCKKDLRDQQLIECTRCKMAYYCSADHMKNDKQHRQLCYALRQVADSSGNHLFYKCGDFTTEQFRTYRIVNIRKVEATMNRSLTATEQEAILFPRICGDIKCREYRFNKLADCSKCGQVAYCKDKPEHLSKFHNLWCKPYQLFKEMIIFQEHFGRLDPSLPSKVLKDIPGACSTTKQILSKLDFDMHNPCEYAALSQISTGPLTAWYALKLCDQLKKSEIMTVHLIGAEIEFEVDVLHKWELFFLHITPQVKQLNVVFVGPELNPRNISFEQLKKTKCCRVCRKAGRTVNYHFENRIYHEYAAMPAFLKPDLICFFNAGLYRSTGFHLEDTWPETILAAANLKCPVVVTSYTEYEAPLDMTRFVQESNRRLNVVLPPTVNTFCSDKPERNFISDEDAPLMFKNYYCFVVE